MIDKIHYKTIIIYLFSFNGDKFVSTKHDWVIAYIIFGY